MLTAGNYHYIREDFTAPYPSIFGVTPRAFREQLKRLKNEGDFIHPKNLSDNFSECLHSKDNYWLVTFDDGLREQYDYALPELDALGIAAFFFANSRNREKNKVSTVHQIHLLRSVASPGEFLKKLAAAEVPELSQNDKTRSHGIYRYDDAATAELKYLLNFKIGFDRQETVIKSIFDDYFSEDEILDKLYMTTQHYIALAQNGCLGSHTHSHYPLGLLSAEKIRFELEHSKNYFEILTKSPIDTVAYPYGTTEAATPEVAAIAEKAGYKLGFTTIRGVNSGNENPLLLNRFDCNDLPGGKNFKGWK